MRTALAALLVSLFALPAYAQDDEEIGDLDRTNYPMELVKRPLILADGIAFDSQGNLYVCANQPDANQIQVLSVSGTPQIIQRYGGAPGDDALDFPASIAFRGNQAYIANLALLDAGDFGHLSVIGTPNPGAQP